MPDAHVRWIHASESDLGSTQTYIWKVFIAVRRSSSGGSKAREFLHNHEWRRKRSRRRKQSILEGESTPKYLSFDHKLSVKKWSGTFEDLQSFCATNLQDHLSEPPLLSNCDKSHLMKLKNATHTKCDSVTTNIGTHGVHEAICKESMRGE